MEDLGISDLEKELKEFKLAMEDEESSRETAQFILDKFDKNCNGVLELQEFKVLIEEFYEGMGKGEHISEEEIIRMFEETDTKHTNYIDKEEFFPLYKQINANILSQMEKVLLNLSQQPYIFQLSLPQLQSALTHVKQIIGDQSTLQGAANSILQKFDLNKNGVLDLEEFTTCMETLYMGVFTLDSINKEQILHMFKEAADRKQNNVIDKEEFLPLYKKINLMIIEELDNHIASKTNEVSILDMTKEQLEITVTTLKQIQENDVIMKVETKELQERFENNEKGEMELEEFITSLKELYKTIGKGGLISKNELFDMFRESNSKHLNIVHKDQFFLLYTQITQIYIAQMEARIAQLYT